MVITSWRVHSIHARQSSMSGASILRGLKRARPADSSLLLFRPVNDPRNAVCFASFGPGIFIAKLSLNRMRSAVCRCGCTTMPTIGGCMESGAHQAIGAAFEMPRHDVVTMATGPGFRRRRASVGSQSRRIETRDKSEGRETRPSKSCAQCSSVSGGRCRWRTSAASGGSSSRRAVPGGLPGAFRVRR